MTTRSLAAIVPIATGLAMVPILVCMTLGIWTRSLSMDNRFYFYVAERAASGVAPHVSAPDAKTQLSALVDGASITLGRSVGLDDVRSGRAGTLLILIAGIWGIALSVYALGATRLAATLGAMSVLAFSGLAGHVSVGFNPKILLFALLAWGPWLVARGRFFVAGGLASAAMCCWQPALLACAATALASVATPRRQRALLSCIAGGVSAFALYESYFAWHGVLAAQLFQNFALPQGSIHDSVDWVRGAEFVVFGSWQGIDRVGTAGICFLVFLAGAIARLLGVKVPAAGRAPASAAAVVLVLAGGALMAVFTAYEHQAEPDRFLLCAYLAIAVGVVCDRVLQMVRSHVHAFAAVPLQLALAGMLLVHSFRGRYEPMIDSGALESQIDAGRVIAMTADAYGSVWGYGCWHLLGLAHLTNHHPLANFWDDLRPYVDEASFSPLVHGRMPDVIVSCRGIPNARRILGDYKPLRVPGLAAEKARLLVRKPLAPKRPRALPPAAPRA